MLFRDWGNQMELLLPNGTIAHINMDYNPQKAHEYYMRTRQLHPRTTGRTKQSVGRHHTTRTSSQHHTTKTSSQHSSEQRVYAAQRVSELKSRLAELTAELRSRLAAASKRGSSSKKKPTPTDKRKAAQQSKRYRDTHKQKLASQRKQAAAKTHGLSSVSTDEIKREIANIKVKLKAAVAAQRRLIANG